MFIAFKWLVGMAMAMWVMMCCLDIYLKRSKENAQAPVSACRKNSLKYLYKNITKPNDVLLQKTQGIKIVEDKHTKAAWHCAMFIAGGLAVSLYNRKIELISYTKYKIRQINCKVSFNKITNDLKLTAIIISIAIVKYLRILSAMLNRYLLKLRTSFILMQRLNQSPNIINLALLQKCKQFSEERKHLGQLLVAAIQENKNIRLKYQFENMSKNRLLSHIENTQKQIKENRSRYVNFKQMYLVTSKENIFLKLRIAKLNREKENTERSLMALVNEVYRSKNKALLAYCSRFIVQDKDNLLNTDVKSEIEKFLQKYKGHDSSKSDAELQRGGSLPICGSACITDVPKLKGLPGECIWTVKDKDGIIEKLYEYDYDSDFDNGDTVRRIREYSVYHDKDCLLDFASSRTIMYGTSSGETLRDSYSNLITSERFLTNSSAFKSFLQSNNNIVSTRSFPLSLHV